MDYVTYPELVERYGDQLASALLTTVEKESGIDGRITPLDKAQRLQRALAALNTTDQSAAAA